jgi:hypothetical protein
MVTGNDTVLEAYLPSIKGQEDGFRCIGNSILCVCVCVFLGGLEQHWMMHWSLATKMLPAC